MRRPWDLCRIERPHDGAADIFALADEQPDLGHVVLRDAGQRIVAAALQRQAPQRTSLVLHLRHVLGVAAEIEVIGVAASPLVAAMADLQSLGDRPVPRDPRRAVRHQAPYAEGELAVAVGLGRGLPDMAAREEIDLGVSGEALLEGPVAGATPVGFTRTLTHASQFTRNARQHLFWSLEFLASACCGAILHRALFGSAALFRSGPGADFTALRVLRHHVVLRCDIQHALPCRRVMQLVGARPRFLCLL